MSGPREVRAQQRLQRQCVSCKSQFHPHPRLGTRQKTCGKDSCQRKHRAGYRRNYRRENLQADQEYESKRRKNRPSDYWKKYREAHPTYTQRNRAQSQLRKKLKKVGLQRQLDIVQLIDPPEKLDALIGFATSHRSLLEECRVRPAA